MQRLAAFRPHLSGAVCAARDALSAAPEPYCDDGKAAEIALVNAGLDFELAPGSDADASVLTLAVPCRELGEPVTLHLHVLDHDALRGALKADTRGRTWRGDLAALERLLAGSVSKETKEMLSERLAPTLAAAGGAGPRALPAWAWRGGCAGAPRNSASPRRATSGPCACRSPAAANSPLPRCAAGRCW
ncbi:MAG: hypothetical protein U1F25_18585 [Rubrivivax sp.]